MIQYYSHNQIDKVRWDDCIARSVNRRIYAFSWYLDRVCPGWAALIAENYEAVFPLTRNRKLTVNYLYQPFFAQQLGLFSPTEVTQEVFDEFISSIPSNIRFAEIQLNSMNNLPIQGWRTKSRVNHELSLKHTYPEISSRYSQNTKRNLKKAAESGVKTGEPISIDGLIDLFKTNFGDREGKLKEGNYQTIRSLMTYFQEHKMGKPVAVYSADNRLSASAFFVQDALRVYFLFAASSPLARDNGAMFFLIDQYISNHAGGNLLLDFEGGNDPQLGRFYKSFGADEVVYPAISINRLPFLFRLGLKFTRKSSN